MIDTLSISNDIANFTVDKSTLIQVMYWWREAVRHHYGPNELIHPPPLVPQWIGSALVKIMARRLFGAKPLSEPVMGYYQLDS